MFHPLELLDKLAGRWLDWRMEQMAARHPELHEFGLHRAEVEPDGRFTVTGISVTAAILADEMAAMLNRASADNYIEFDMAPRLDRGIRPVRVTVQWANGLSPAQKATRLEQRVAELEAQLAVIDQSTGAAI